MITPYFINKDGSAVTVEELTSWLKTVTKEEALNTIKTRYNIPMLGPLEMEMAVYTIKEYLKLCKEK